MLITRDLDHEFRQSAKQSEALGMLRTSAREVGPYTYLAPDYVRSPKIVQGMQPVRVGNGIANAGSNSTDSSYLSGVEKRAIMKYAGSIMYTEPEMMGPLVK